MRGVLLKSFGSEDGLHLVYDLACAGLDKPLPAGHMLLRVKSVSISAEDIAVRKGELPEVAAALPRVLGYHVAGVVEAMAEEDSSAVEAEGEDAGISRGDAVAGLLPLTAEQAGCAEYVVLPIHAVVRKPALLPFDDAAALLTGGLWAATAMYYRLRLCKGDVVLLLSGASACGHIALQLARQCGATVVVTASCRAEWSFLQQFAGDGVRICQRGRDDVLAAVLAESGGAGAAAILDPCGVATSTALEALAEEEAAVMSGLAAAAAAAAASAPAAAAAAAAAEAGASAIRHGGEGTDGKDVEAADGSKEAEDMDAPAAAAVPMTLLLAALAVNGSLLTSSSAIELAPAEARLLLLKGGTLSFVTPATWLLSPTRHGKLLHVMEELLRAGAAGELQPHVSRTFPLDRVTEAHRFAEAHSVGVVVLQPVPT
eukprot:PLAT12428.1.p1 GENE.PLAT12428.1~~PLAT12428.1.p1  ORF type:complete len:429 (+),score=203.47 PLAT12428.1:56-1342(+)